MSFTISQLLSWMAVGAGSGLILVMLINKNFKMPTLRVSDMPVVLLFVLFGYIGAAVTLFATVVLLLMKAHSLLKDNDTTLIR